MQYLGRSSYTAKVCLCFLGFKGGSEKKIRGKRGFRPEKRTSPCRGIFAFLLSSLLGGLTKQILPEEPQKFGDPRRTPTIHSQRGGKKNGRKVLDLPKKKHGVCGHQITVLRKGGGEKLQGKWGNSRRGCGARLKKRIG